MIVLKRPKPKFIFVAWVQSILQKRKKMAKYLIFSLYLSQLDIFT